MSEKKEYLNPFSNERITTKTIRPFRNEKKSAFKQTIIVKRKKFNSVECFSVQYEASQMFLINFFRWTIEEVNLK